MTLYQELKVFPISQHAKGPCSACEAGKLCLVVDYIMTLLNNGVHYITRSNMRINSRGNNWVRADETRTVFIIAIA